MEPTTTISEAVLKSFEASGQFTAEQRVALALAIEAALTLATDLDYLALGAQKLRLQSKQKQQRRGQSR